MYTKLWPFLTTYLPLSELQIRENRKREKRGSPVSGQVLCTHYKMSEGVMPPFLTRALKYELDI